MPAVSARGRPASAGLLSIGQVLARLSQEFPGLSTSKLRFLEVQGIVTPVRTDSGYRKFSPHDLERLRVALRLQRDHYLPLVVIKEQLDQLDDGHSPDVAAPPPALPPSIVATPRRYRRDELIAAAGTTAQMVHDAITAGVFPASETYNDQALALLRALVALHGHGIEPRHLRVIRQSAEREIDLVEQAVGPLLRRTDAASRARAHDTAPELARRLDEVRGIFVRAGLDRLGGS